MATGNVQLAAAERCQVYTDPTTKRILGFGPEGAKPMFPAGVRVRTDVLFFAHEIERWMKKFREQSLRDAEEATVRRLESEKETRKAIFDAVLDRNNQVDARNRDINIALLKAMDFYYHNALNKRRNAEVCMPAEKYEAGKNSVDVALDNPAIELAN